MVNMISQVNFDINLVSINNWIQNFFIKKLTKGGRETVDSMILIGVEEYGIELVCIETEVLEISDFGWVVSGNDVVGSIDSTDVVTGLNVLTLSDVETTELELLDVKTELDDGVDDEVLTKGLEVVTIWDCVLSIEDSV